MKPGFGCEYREWNGKSRKVAVSDCGRSEQQGRRSRVSVSVSGHVVKAVFVVLSARSGTVSECTTLHSPKVPTYVILECAHAAHALEALCLHLWAGLAFLAAWCMHVPSQPPGRRHMRGSPGASLQPGAEHVRPWRASWTSEACSCRAQAGNSTGRVHRVEEGGCGFLRFEETLHATTPRR